MTNANRIMYPQVLVLGNGVLRAYGGGAENSCSDLEKLICQALGAESPFDDESQIVPFTMRIAASLAGSEKSSNPIERAVNLLVQERIKGDAVTNELLCNSGIKDALCFKKLLEAGFTDVITTNYGYEVEEVLCGKHPTCDDMRRDFYRSCSGPKNTLLKGIRERKFKIWRHYLSRNGATRIWHVHGEYLKPQSIIFEYADYCSLLSKIKNYPRPQCNESTEESLEEGNGTPKNWVQAFLKGDVYILGFSAALGELAFWRMMEKRKRKDFENGMVHFYEPKFEYREEKNLLKNHQQKAVLTMLKAFGAKRHDLDVKISESNEGDFKSFYQKAIEDIIQKVQGCKIIA